MKKEKPISSNYVLHIDNKWYVDVKKYVEIHNTNQIEAGEDLLSKGFIRQKLGSSSLATLVRRRKLESLVCFELTPLGQSSLTGAVKGDTANSKAVSTKSTKAKSKTVKKKVTAGKAGSSLPSSDPTEFEYTNTSIKGSLGEILLAHKIKVTGGQEYIDIILKKRGAR